MDYLMYIEKHYVKLKSKQGPAGEVFTVTTYRDPQCVNYSRPYTASVFIPVKADKRGYQN
jgi:hypothetical protein